MRKIDLLIIHCSDTYDHMDIGVKEIRKWHVEERGWSDIGYHRVIRRDGTVEMGRPIERSGAHTKGHNSHSVGICVVGGKSVEGGPENNFTEAQFKALRREVWGLISSHPQISVHGHNEFSTKDCPCFSVKQWMEEYKV